MRFEFVAKHRGIWPVSWICETLDVSRCGFHAWMVRAPSARAHSDEELGAKVRASFVSSYRTYGARRVWHDLLAEGLSCGLHRIERLMRVQGLHDGPMNGDAFTTYVTRVLAPELSRGDVVIMDNLSSHKAPAVCAAIEAAGARLLFLPPYSPDFNPIEQALLQAESHLRKAAERTIHGLWDAIGRILDLYSPPECANCFANAGYDAD